MSTISDSMVSSSSRRLRMRARQDLTATRQLYQGQTYWVVKDPVALNYFRFQEEEYAILQMLDGSNSLDQIKRRFERQFPPQKITVEELSRLVGMLHSSALIISDAPGQGRALKKRSDERWQKQMVASMTNVLAFRFKGFDPDRVLTWIYPWFRWFFAPATAVCCVLLALAALTLVIVQWQTFQAKLPSFNDFFAARNWIWLALTLSATKVIHEFGHGLACKHFRGECHEMGVMFLVLTPCLYCNVSDSWLLPNKWHRAAIGAAGIYIELVLASICTFIWWFTHPGLLHYLALNVMFVSSVSTILFNANPLLRYDGYYILSDIAEIPNLRQKSGAVLNRLLGSWFLGMEYPHDPFLPQRNHAFFALYTVAASIYRWVVVLSILFFLNIVFKPIGLQRIGQLIAVAAMWGLVVQPLWKLYKFFLVPGRLQKVKKVRMFVSLAAVATVLLGVALIPLPHYVTAALEIQPRGAETVYVTVPGVLQESHVEMGQLIKKGELIATLSNIDVELAVARLEGERQRILSRLEVLRFAARTDDQAAAEMSEAEASLETTEIQLNKRLEDGRRLHVITRENGTVLPPAEKPEEPPAQGQLPVWSGTPLAPQNQRAYLDLGTVLCRVGDPTDLQAVIAISQGDIEFVRKDLPVKLQINGLPDRIFRSTIDTVARQDLQFSSRSMSAKAGGDLETSTDSSGQEVPLNAIYQASARLADPDDLITIGTRGTAKIRTGHQTLGGRLARYLSQTFNFEL